MNITSIDFILNLLLLTFWARIWIGRSSDSFFNPFISMLLTPSDKAISFLDRTLGKIPDLLETIAVTVFIFVSKCLIIKGLAAGISDSPIILSIGIARYADISDLRSCLITGALTFGIMLFNIWALAMIYANGRFHQTRSSGALKAVAAPFSYIPVQLQPVILVIFSCLLAIAADATGTYCPSGPLTVELGWGSDPVAAIAVKLTAISLTALVNVISVICTALIAFIVISWIGLMSGKPDLTMMAKEFTDLILGPFRRYPIMIGMLDISPIIFLIVLQNFLHPVLLNIIVASF